jgi:hypothetical protein
MRVSTVTTERASIVPVGRGRQRFEYGSFNLELIGSGGVQGNTWHML